MDKLSTRLRLLVLMFAGWVNREQLAVIDDLREENAVLREQMGSRRLRLNDDQRRRLDVRPAGAGSARRAGSAEIWHRTGNTLSAASKQA